MAADPTHCVICSTSALESAPYHRITHKTTAEDQPSLGERISKVLRVDDIYSVYNRGTLHNGPLFMCTTCVASLRHIEAAAKLKKKLKRSFKDGLCQAKQNASPSGGGEHSIVVETSGQRSDRMGKSKKKKGSKNKHKLSVGDLQLCIREIDEIITYILQDELIHKGRSQAEATDGPDLLSTELTIVKEMFCELDKELENGRTELVSSTSDSVIQELSELVKKRIKMDYRDRLIQHLQRMVAYISKHSSKFDAKGDGLQKFCEVLQRDSRDEADSIDSLSVSSTQSSVSCSSISINLRQSVDDIFKQTASQIAQAWLESSSVAVGTKDQTSSPTTPNVEMEEITDGFTEERSVNIEKNRTANVEKDFVIGEHMQRIINGDDEKDDVDVEGEEDERGAEVAERDAENGGGRKDAEERSEEDGPEVIDIESVESDEAPINRTLPDDDDNKEPPGLIKPKEELLSDQDDGQHNMIIDDDTGDEGIKQEADIEEIEPEKKEAVDVPLICIDSDDDDDDETSGKDSSWQDEASDSVEQSAGASMLSYEEMRWQHQQQFGRGQQGSKDGSDAINRQSSPRGQPTQTNSAQAESVPVPDTTNSFGGPVGMGQYSSQGYQKSRKHYVGWRPNNMRPGGKGQPKTGMGCRKPNKFPFKNKKHKNQQINQQGGALGKKQFGKHKSQNNKHKNANPPIAGIERLYDSIRSPPGASKLDIIPVISATASQSKPASAPATSIEQGRQQVPVTIPAQSTGLAKFTFKRNNHQRKPQMNRNPGGNRGVTKQPGYRSNPYVWTSDKNTVRPKGPGYHGNLPSLMSLSVGPGPRKTLQGSQQTTTGPLPDRQGPESSKVVPLSGKTGPQSAKPGLQLNKPGPQSAKPGLHLTKPGPRSAKPGLHLTKPGPRSAKPGLHLTKPGSQSAKPGLPLTKPCSQSAKLGLPLTKPDPQSAKPGLHLTKPNPSSAKQGMKSPKPGLKLGNQSPKPGLQSTKPGHQSMKPGHHSAKPGLHSGKPSPQSAKPSPKSTTGKPAGLQSTKPGLQLAKPGPGSAKPSLQSSKPGLKSTKPGIQSSKPDLHSAKPGLGSSKPGSVKSVPTTTSQPPVMHVLGSSTSQTLHVKARF